jgi:hypothetical protein
VPFAVFNKIIAAATSAGSGGEGCGDTRDRRIAILEWR